RPMHACFRRLHRVMLIMDWRGRACEVKDLVHFHIERESDIMPDHFEVLVVEQQVLDVATRTSEEIINADDDRSVSEQALAEMRTEKPGAAGNQHTFFKVHFLSLRLQTLFERDDIESLSIDLEALTARRAPAGQSCYWMTLKSSLPYVILI